MNDRSTALYRHFDADGSLLYVGISLRPFYRLCEHRESSDWFEKISRVEIEWFSDRSEALHAERLAIQRERPAHNVVHARFRTDGHPTSKEEAEWPIPAEQALIAWGYEGAVGRGDIGAVAVGYQPYRCGSPRWFEGYANTCGACDTERKELSNTQRQMAALSDYFMLTNVYEIDPRVAASALLNIREFREAIESTPQGWNILNFDCQFIEDNSDLVKKQFWHSVHVFPSGHSALIKMQA